MESFSRWEGELAPIQRWIEENNKAYGKIGELTRKPKAFPEKGVEK